MIVSSIWSQVDNNLRFLHKWSKPTVINADNTQSRAIVVVYKDRHLIRNSLVGYQRENT